MPYLLVIILALAAFLVLMQLAIYHQSRKQIGSKLPDASLTGGTDNDRPLLLYFHSPRCGVCKTVTPIITQMAEDNRNVISIDVSQNLEAARTYKVRATPTVIQVKDGVIAQVLLGAQSREKLESLLL